MADSIDLEYSITAETTAGTTPATPTFLRVPHKSGNNFNLENDTIDSGLMMPKRAGAGVRPTKYRSVGSMGLVLHRGEGMDLLLASALSGSWATNTLKAAEDSNPLTVEKSYLEGGTRYYSRFLGCEASKFSLSADASANAEVSADFVGMGDDHTSAIVTGATYTDAPGQAFFLTGDDVANITIGGFDVTYSKLALTVDQARDAKHGLGSADAFGVSTTGSRKVTLDLTYFKNGDTDHSIFKTTAPMAVSFTIGSGAKGYTFSLPAATVSQIVKEADDGGSYMGSVQFVASHDATAGCDLSVTKLS